MTEERKVSERYRELPREEPPRRLDDAILAASRRATASRPAPLVAPTGRRRWYYPVAAAAIIVLAVAVTLHLEREQENVEVGDAPVSVPPASSEPRSPAAPAELSKREVFTPDPKPAPGQRQSTAPARGSRGLSTPRGDQPLADAQKAPRAESAPPPEQAPARTREAERAEAQGPLREQRAMTAAGRLAGAAAPSPEQWLQGIADLRRQGRHDEADRQLAEFRKRYPDYRISEALREKLEKR